MTDGPVAAAAPTPEASAREALSLAGAACALLVAALLAGCGPDGEGSGGGSSTAAGADSLAGCFERSGGRGLRKRFFRGPGGDWWQTYFNVPRARWEDPPLRMRPAPDSTLRSAERALAEALSAAAGLEGDAPEAPAVRAGLQAGPDAPPAHSQEWFARRFYRLETPVKSGSREGARYAMAQRVTMTGTELDVEFLSAYECPEAALQVSAPTASGQ